MNVFTMMTVTAACSVALILRTGDGQNLFWMVFVYWQYWASWPLLLAN